MEKEKIVVFGATGDIGTYFIDFLIHSPLSENYEIIAVGTRANTLFSSLGVRYFRVDISNKSSFTELPTNVFAVVDLAGAMPARMKGYQPELYLDVNIKGMYNILEYCRKNGVDRILFSQSFGDIKDHAQKNPLLTVDLPRNFSFQSDHTVYVISKNAAVDLIENYHQMYSIRRFIFRLPTIYLYSPVDTYFVDGVSRKIGYRLLIDRAKAGDPLEVWGDPSREKDMIYVKDFCQMLSLALLVDRKEGFYNVGTGIGTSLLDQITGIAEIFSPVEKKSPILFCPEKPNAPQYIMDISNAKSELGYAPRYDYRSLLKDMKHEMELNRFSRNGSDLS